MTADAPRGTVTVLYFATLREAAGRGEETVPLADGIVTVADLVHWLQARDNRTKAAFADLARVRAAVNQRHVPFDHAVATGDEVAFFPPVTGGRRA